MRKAAVLLATCFGAGYAPIAPGTVGAAVGLIPTLLLAPWPLAYCFGAALLLLTGVAASSAAETALGQKDSPRIVIDEAASIMVGFAGVAITWKILLCGFVLNRFLDIIKPFPARRLQELSGGWGVMLDDLVAGLYVNFILRVLALLV